MKKNILFLAFLLFPFFLGFSEEAITLSGTVVDKYSKALSKVKVVKKRSSETTTTNAKGSFSIKVLKNDTLVFSKKGFSNFVFPVNGKKSVKVIMLAEKNKKKVEEREVVMVNDLQNIMSCTMGEDLIDVPVEYDKMRKESTLRPRLSSNVSNGASRDISRLDYNTEEYSSSEENNFKNVKTDPISVFGADVDNASYSNVRRLINNGQEVPKGSVRTEEMINYFSYSYPDPQNNEVVSINTEISKCPWNNKHQLLQIGLKAKSIEAKELTASNLVFLVDVSGSMNSENKLPLLVRSLNVLLENMRSHDKIAIVTYAGAADLVLKSTNCDSLGKLEIKKALNSLSAGGWTNGNQGINVAYDVAEENFIKSGNNRIIMATDGDFNIGNSSDSDMKSLIEKKRESGIYLTVLGFGMGNYKDSKMEILADAGNGNYAYIDNIFEAKKALGTEIWSNLYVVAKDVKILADFNPAKIKSYRLIGYENRMLSNEDFNDDKKDAGDMGSGHTVTALYELIPAENEEKSPKVELSEYQKGEIIKSDNLLTVKFRYKNPTDTASLLVVHKVEPKDVKSNPSDNFILASSVAEFSLLLKDSEHKGDATYNDVLRRLSPLPSDENGYIDELKVLVRRASNQ